MRKPFYTMLWFMIGFFFFAFGTLKAQSGFLSWTFASDSIGYSFPHIGWSPSDVQAVVADDPLVSGHKVLRNTIHNYNAAPVLLFVLPAGKTLADYGSFAFKGYFAQGDVGYKNIVVEAYQTMPTGQFANDTTKKIGSWNRSQMGSTSWENIVVNLTDSSSLQDTIYIAFGINCAGTGDVGATGDTTIWYADSVTLVAKADTTTPAIVTNGGFESSNTGIVDTTAVKGWLIQVASGITPPPVFEIVSDTVEQGSRALKVTLHGLGANQWDIQAVADSLRVTPGATYNYSIWAKADKAGATVNFTVGNYSYSEYKALRPATLSTKWQNFTMQFTVSDTSKVIRAPIHFYGVPDTGNSIYIDNLQIVENAPPPDTGTVYKGPALAAGQPKFLGCAYDPGLQPTFLNYWNQVTPENAGKFGTVATSADSSTWNWAGLDSSYNFAINNHLVFKDHNLIWGNQQPSWITAAGFDSAHQVAALEQWIRMVGRRYPQMNMIDVVNEPLPGHAPPAYAPALGGAGATGWDWVIWAFQKARAYMPANTKLLLNDYNILNSSANTTALIQIINLLKTRGLIDGIGIQCHRFELESTDTNLIRTNLNQLAATGIPIYISEFDLGNIGDTGTPNDATQLQLYQKYFPLLWQYPDVKGITIWGYIQGQTWQTTSYLVRSDGTARPALLWLANYIKNNPLGVGGVASTVPSNFRLEQNFPNPFNPSTVIRYQLPAAGHVTLKVFDVLGREVETLVDEKQNAGYYNITFNANKFASGVYFYELRTDHNASFKKMLLLK